MSAELRRNGLLLQVMVMFELYARSMSVTLTDGFIAKRPMKMWGG